MYPLLRREGLMVPLLAITALYNIFAFSWKQADDVLKWLMKVKKR